MRKALWNPWHGCHKCSPGCRNCFVYYFDKKRNRDTSIVTRSKTNFSLPLKRDRQGNFKIKEKTEVATCFTSDFFIEEADIWREEAWNIIRQRPDIDFLICTKRIERFPSCLPNDWKEGYSNVIIAVTCENQAMADKRLPILLSIQAKRKYILASPLLEEIDFSAYLKDGQIDLVSVGGESYANARICDFDWVKHIKEDCTRYHVPFSYHQTGTHFRVHGKIYTISHRDEYKQAKRGMKYL